MASASSFTMTSASVNITADVRVTSPVTLEYGIRATDITRRVATPGTMSFELDNSANNVGGLLGYYSPDHANAASDFAIGNETNLAITYSGSTFTKFVGKIDSISPVGGKRKKQAVRVSVVDWFGAAGRFKINADIPIQIDQRMDQIITTALSAITEQPKSTSLSTGQDTFSISLDSGNAKQTTMLRVLQKGAQSEMGYIYPKGDNASGGILTFEDRHFRIKRTSSCTSASLNDTMVRLRVGRTRKRVKNIIRTNVHPRDVEVSASDIFSLDFKPEIFPSASMLIVGEYKDPNTNKNIGGACIIVPVAGTDYTMNTTEDGTGTDLTYDQKGRVISAATDASKLIGYWTLGDAAGTTSVKEETDIYKDRYGTACLVTFGRTGIGDGRTAASFDGAFSYVDIYSSDLNSDFDGNQGTIMGWSQVSGSADWSDSTWRTIMRLGVDTASNLVAIDKTNTASQLRFLHAGGGSIVTATDTSLGAATTGAFHMGMTWDSTASALIGYLNGASVASAALYGAMSGNLDASLVCIGASNNSDGGNNNWKGDLSHMGIYNEVLPASEFLNIYNAGSGGFNLDTEIGGFATEFNIANQNNSAGFVTKLQLRGRRVKDFQPTMQETKSASSQTSYGDLELLYDMPYQENPLVGKDAADWLLDNLKDPITDVTRVEFVANDSDALMKYMLRGEPGDRIRIQETVSGIDVDFFINGVRLKITKGDIIHCTWYVTPVHDRGEKFWALEVTGHGELEQQTYLVF